MCADPLITTLSRCGTYPPERTVPASGPGHSWWVSTRWPMSPVPTNLSPLTGCCPSVRCRAGTALQRWATNL